MEVEFCDLLRIYINDIEHSESTEVQKRNHEAANHYRSEYSQRNIEI